MRLTPFLMFTGTAEAAMNFYLALFPDSRVESIERSFDRQEAAVP
ncbi:MAG: VOC family protein [Thermoanaerobaculia bacterium]